MSVKLAGLTIVLIDNAGKMDPVFERQMGEALESWLRAKELGTDLRLFTVGDKLVELLQIPESFAWLGRDTPAHIAAAVNRVNILRPRRIVVHVPAVHAARIGYPRDGTTGYLWCGAPDPIEHSPVHWTMLHCEPAQIPISIHKGERRPYGDHESALR